MNDALAQLSEARDAYVATLRDVLLDERSRHPEAATEVLVRLNDPTLDEIAGLQRIDILERVDGAPSVIRVVGDPLAGPDHGLPTTFQMTPDLDVTVTSFAWHGLLFEMLGEMTDTSRYDEWFATGSTPTTSGSRSTTFPA